MLVRRDTVEREPGKVRQLVRAHAEATRFFQRNREEWIRRAAEFGAGSNVLRRAAENVELTWDMDDVFVAQVKRLGEEMLERGMIERPPDWDRLIVTQFVAEVRAGLR